MAQSYITETRYGKIKVSRNAVARAAVDSLEDIRDVVFLCNHRGKLIKKGTDAELTAVDVDAFEGDLRIKVNVIMKFGVSITVTADKIADRVQKALRLTLGRGPSSVSVVVKGVRSKNVAARDIVIKREMGGQER